MYKNRQHPTEAECRLFCCPILLSRCRFCSFLKLLSYRHTAKSHLFFLCGAGEGNIRPSRISDRQSRRWRVLDSRFAGVEYSKHPHPNPLHVRGSLRLGFFPRDPLHVKNPLSGTLRGAGEGKIRPSRISDRQSRRLRRP